MKDEIEAVLFHPGLFFLRRLKKKIQLLKSTIAWFQCELTVLPELISLGIIDEIQWNRTNAAFKQR